MTNSADPDVLPSARPPRWQSLGAEDLDSLAQARAEAINLVQWLARVANSFVPGRVPEERMLLEFRAADTAFITKLFEHNRSLELRLPTLQLQFLEDGKPVPHVLDPEGLSPAEVEAWLLVELLHRGLDRTKLSKELPYTVPGLMTGDAKHHSPQSRRQAHAQLAAFLANAAAILEAAAAGKTRVACWPQTLDLTCRLGQASRAEFGFSPGGVQDGEPFFYARAANGGKPRILTASQLAAESDTTRAAIEFLVAAAG